uniref:Uncharacterized protein n=1 Tax=Vespula pensylvanica TaxID=30213 RepID=A0A834U5H4_VESPE|nr:hypothetical protein H0235_011758 [Vespula pensylvanica]
MVDDGIGISAVIESDWTLRYASVYILYQKNLWCFHMHDRVTTYPVTTANKFKSGIAKEEEEEEEEEKWEKEVQEEVGPHVRIFSKAVYTSPYL